MTQPETPTPRYNVVTITPADGRRAYGSMQQDAAGNWVRYSEERAIDTLREIRAQQKEDYDRAERAEARVKVLEDALRAVESLGDKTLISLEGESYSHGAHNAFVDCASIARAALAGSQSDREEG